MQSIWNLQDAKNKFSAVVNAAVSGSPQIVTKRGTPVAVVVSKEEYDRLNQKSVSFVDMLLSMPTSDDFELEEHLEIQPQEVEL